MSSWKQLRDWLGDDQLDRALYSQVVSDAQTWDLNGRDSSYLYRPRRLATVDAAATRWQHAPTRYLPLPAAGTAFLGAAHRAARRGTARRRGVIAGLLALVVLAAGAAGIAVRAAVNASTQHAIALSRILTEEGLALALSDPLTARQLAVAAWRVSPTTQAGTAMMTLLAEQQQDGILPGGPPTPGVSVAFSPDGKLLASADADGTVKLWNTATGQPSGVALQAGTSTKFGVYGVAFGPGGTLLASAGSDGTVRLWNTTTAQEVGAPIMASAPINPDAPGPGGGVDGVAFSPHGTLLASADADGTVRLWNPATRREIGAPITADPGTGGGVLGVALSPDGTLVAGAYSDGTVQTWQISLFTDPYAALCADVGPPTKADWTRYAAGEPQPSVCG